MLAPQLKQLFARLPDALRRDQTPLRRRIQQLQQRKTAPDSAELVALHAALETSCAQRAWRAAHLPQPDFPEELPVSARREEIAEAIRQHQVIVVAGETGSGKTTQLPKICLQAGRGVAGLIGCTQPRRIAARSIANRIAAELHSELGHWVGYKIRFTDRLSEHSYIKLMTDGILLAESRQDRLLDAYDTLIIDEAHERSLNIDFLLGYLKTLLPKRPDLKLIITSATIDTARFAAHFNQAPVIAVTGRAYPVELRYRPLASLDRDIDDRDLQQGILDAVDEIASSAPYHGDILVFLSGERDIRETAETLRKHHPPGTQILPLYARLSATEQDQVFKPSTGQRRIVLATNVAETSLTVPGIRAVIDPGLARLSRYSVRSKVQHLQIETISKASADQRKGRCGRVGPGLCIRLYDEADFAQRPDFTPPEILRTSLATVILRMLDLGLGKIEHFPFLDAPDSRAINDGYRQLEELGAITRQGGAAREQLTEIGKQLASLPIDVRIGRMIIAARQQGCLREVLIIAAALSLQDPRERPLEARQAADLAQAPFQDEKSDFLSFLKLWDFYHEQAKHLSKNKLHKLCQTHFLSYLRMQEWLDIHQQLFSLVRKMGWLCNEIPAEYEAIHCALLAGLLSNIANKSDQDGYLGARGLKLNIFPGSALFKKKPRWCVAAELVDTSRLYARCVASVDPAWIEAVAGALCKHSYSEPHWERRRAQVAAFEQVSLYGLTLVVKRKVNYGPLDPPLAREIFIREALVHGDWQTRLPFFAHNLALIAEIQDLENKARRQDILVDEQQLFEFYDAQIPAALYNGPAFERWYQQATLQQPKLLWLSREFLMRRDSPVGAEAFPATRRLANTALPLRYHFEPGADNDGVTVSLPLSLLPQLQAAPFDWLVPGLLLEKITALLRALPKALRKAFVPVPDFARAAVEALTPSEQPLLEVLSAYLHRISGVPIPLDAWQAASLPPHLQMRYELLDEQGTVLDAGRDLLALQHIWRDQTHARFAQLPKAQWEREGIQDWDFAALPAQVMVPSGPLQLTTYPALVDCQDSVALRLFDDPAAAAVALRAGLLRLYALKLATPLKNLRRRMPVTQTMCLHYLKLGSCEALKDDLLNAVLDAVLLVAPLPTDRETFTARLPGAEAKLFAATAEHAALLEKVLATYHSLQTALPRFDLSHGLQLDNIRDLKIHLTHLIYPGFLRNTPLSRLPHLPRYLKAIELRLTRLAQSPSRDAQKEAELAPLWNAYWQRRQRTPLGQQPELDEFRWQLEELRVSLFAQELRTPQPVSVARLEKRWQALHA